ncbi:hypothetical protein PMAYCL1PPCAC_21758, partial [Pristionchus mayeri]
MLAVSMAVVPPIAVLAVAIFVQTFYYLRVGMKNRSEMTRKFQKRAVVTVILMAVVPGIFVGIPFYGTLLMVLKRAVPYGKSVYFFKIYILKREAVFGFLDVFFGSPRVSAALFALANIHSLANSLTIVCRSTKYKRMMAYPIRYLQSRSANR